MKIATLLGVVTSVFVASHGIGQTTWYVHPTQGSDSNVGTSPSEPFRTLGRLAQAFENGDVHSGDEVALTGVNRGSLVVNLDFPTPITNITVRPWEADANPRNLQLSSPVVRGDQFFPNPFSPVPEVNRFTTPLPFPGVMEGVTWNWDTSVDRSGRHFGHLTKVNSTGECDRTPYSWYYDGVTMSVNVTPAGGPTVSPASGVITYVTRGPNAGITLQSAHGCRITGIESELWFNSEGGAYGISCEHASDSIIENCVTRDTSHHGIGFTGFTGSNNTIRNCQVWGLAGLNVDPNGDCFGYLTNDTELTGARIEGCTAHCYVLLTPALQSLYPDRSVHAFRTGTTNGVNLVRDLLVVNMVARYYPQCGPYSQVIRVADAAPPADPAQFSTYSVRVQGLRTYNGCQQYISGRGAHVAFLDCNLDLTQAAVKGLYTTGGIGSGNWVGPEDNFALFQDCGIRTNVVHPNGRFWVGVAIGITAGVDMRFQGCKITDAGRRVNGSTGGMFVWLDGVGGKLTVKDSVIRFESLTGDRLLCKGDANIYPHRRKFQHNTYYNMSRQSPLTEWFPGAPQPDIRWRPGWLSNSAGDPLGYFADDLPTWNGILIDEIDKDRTAVRR